MMYAVLFEDNPQLGTEVRQKHMPQHLAFLERNAAQITAAGPLRTTANEPAGGLWIVEAASNACVWNAQSAIATACASLTTT